MTMDRSTLATLVAYCCTAAMDLECSGAMWFPSQTMQATVARSLVEATHAETNLAALVWHRVPSHRDATVKAAGCRS